MKLVLFFTLSLLASFYVRTFLVDTLSWAKLAKIGESSYEFVRNSSVEKFSAVTVLVIRTDQFDTPN